MCTKVHWLQKLRICKKKSCNPINEAATAALYIIFFHIIKKFEHNDVSKSSVGFKTLFCYLKIIWPRILGIIWIHRLP